jgi:hypothetical protein
MRQTAAQRIPSADVQPQRRGRQLAHVPRMQRVVPGSGYSLRVDGHECIDASRVHARSFCRDERERAERLGS